jgi:hypothetical protein
MVNLKGKDKEGLDFEIGIKKKGEYFNLFIRELAISGKGKTLDEAYKHLLDKKENMVREFEEIGALDEFPKPLSKNYFRSLKESRGKLNIVVETIVSAGVATSVVMGVTFLMLWLAFNEIGRLDQNLLAEISRAGQTFKVGVEQLKKGLDKVKKGLDNVNEGVGQTKGLKLGRLLERELQRAADKEISPERKEKIIQNIRTLVLRYKPILEEFDLLFSGGIERN